MAREARNIIEVSKMNILYECQGNNEHLFIFHTTNYNYLHLCYQKKGKQFPKNRRFFYSIFRKLLANSTAVNAIAKHD